MCLTATSRGWIHNFVPLLVHYISWFISGHRSAGHMVAIWQREQDFLKTTLGESYQTFIRHAPPPIWLAILNNGSQPQAFQDHYFSACMKQNSSDQAKLPGDKSSTCRLPQCQHLSLIWSARLPGGRKQILAKYESSYPWGDIKDMFDACTLKFLISLLWLQRQCGETKSKEDIFTTDV